ncbi:MAG TPA: choice-of-anchor Q domain-containing protein [Candidatus Paceibacterota bacterium]|nr:choice-of-anchor Q domain-containing protein [Candidatus Paceibacterota bacterium]
MTGNSARWGGGADGPYRGTLNNCIVYYNTAQYGANYDGSTFAHSCTTPLPERGEGNIDREPSFVDTNGWSDLRLQSNSPCINAGNNAYAVGAADLDGNPRISGGTVDMGAYEFQDPGSVISYAWLQQYGLPTDSSVDFTDSDGDAHNNWQEWRCGTDPTNSLSVLRLLSVSTDRPNVTLRWPGVVGVSYSLERSTNLAASPPFTLLATNLLGQPGTMSFIDTDAAGLTPLFYRVGVNAP